MDSAAVTIPATELSTCSIRRVTSASSRAPRTAAVAVTIASVLFRPVLFPLVLFPLGRSSQGQAQV